MQLFNKYSKCGNCHVNVDFKNVIPCTNLFWKYMQNFRMVNETKRQKLFLPIWIKRLKWQKVRLRYSTLWNKFSINTGYDCATMKNFVCVLERWYTILLNYECKLWIYDFSYWDGDLASNIQMWQRWCIIRYIEFCSTDKTTGPWINYRNVTPTSPLLESLSLIYF